MQNWKKAVIYGGLGAGAVLFLMGRRPVGIALAAGGLAVLASEYPEKFEDIWENAPEYVSKATQIFTTLSKLSERFVDEAERRGISALHDVRDYAR